MKDKHIESLKRLQHIEQAIITIEQYVNNETEQSFCSNNIVHDAVLFQFTVIGEAIVHVEENKLDKYDYPWYKVRAFRNMIAHEYFNIKISAVWNIIDLELPRLKKTVAKILKNEF